MEDGWIDNADFGKCNECNKRKRLNEDELCEDCYEWRNDSYDGDDPKQDEEQVARIRENWKGKN